MTKHNQRKAMERGMNEAVMIDLETFDTSPTAAIASIGAVRFEPHGKFVSEMLSINVKLAGQQHFGRTINADTVLWWMAQSDAARGALIAGQSIARDLPGALYSLAEFIGESEVWCNGASFDFPILASAYRSIGCETPWKYWQERDLRTLKGLNKDLRIERTGTHHKAVEDALHQARLVQHILNSNPVKDA